MLRLYTKQQKYQKQPNKQTPKYILTNTFIMTDQSVPEILRRRFAVPLLLLLVTMLTYANSFPGTFIMDDIHIVRNNPLVAEFDLWRILRTEYWQGIESNGLYRPLSILSFALNRLLLGSSAWGFHLVNVLLHAGISMLFWRMLQRWNFTSLQSLLASLLFAVHAIHTEVVNQMVGRSELLAALFLLLALTSAKSHSLRSTLLPCAFFLAALLSKENAITFLLLLPLLDWFFAESPKSLRHRLPLYGSLLGITIVWFLWRKFGVLHEFPATIYAPEVVPLAFLPWDGRFLSAAHLQGLYLLKLFLPVGLQGVYSPSDLPDPVISIFNLRGMLVTAGLIPVLAMVLYAWRRRHPLGLFAALYLASFVLTANLFFPIGVTFAERLVYLPSLWFCAAIAVLLSGIIQISKGRQMAKWMGLCSCLLLMMTLTLLRNPDFSSEKRYWQADLRQNPRDYMALIVHAELLAAEGSFAAAEEAFRQVLDLAPTFAYGYRSYTNYLINQRRYDEALAASNKALAIARERGDRTAMGYDLGDQAKIYLELKEYGRALELLNQGAEALGRDDFDLNLRDRALAGLGRNDEAARADRQGKDSASAAKALYDQALQLFQSGRLPEARARLEENTKLPGVGVETWNLLGAVCGQLGDWPGAIAAFEQAVRLAPENRYYAENLQHAKDQQGGER